MEINGNMEVDGLVKQRKELERLMMSNPQMEKRVQALIRQVVLKARRQIAKEAQGKMRSDPRQAYKAVKSAVYKRILGGSVNILSKNGAMKTQPYEPARTLNPDGRGGNRRKRSERTDRIMHYAGGDRAFILRFLNAGTSARAIRFTPNQRRSADKWNRKPNSGNRGKITARRFFGPASRKAMQQAATELAQLIDELIKKEMA